MRLIAAKDDDAAGYGRRMLATARLRSTVPRTGAGVAGPLDEPRVRRSSWPPIRQMEPDLQPQGNRTVDAAAVWSKQLMQAIAAKKIPATCGECQPMRKLLASKDADVRQAGHGDRGAWSARAQPRTRKVVDDMSRFLTAHATATPSKGELVFKNLCAQCHKIHGEGQDVGPDITGNGRASVRSAAVERLRSEPGHRRRLPGDDGERPRRAAP